MIAELEKLSKQVGPLSIRGRVAEEQYRNVKGARAVIKGNGLDLETVTATTDLTVLRCPGRACTR